MKIWSLSICSTWNGLNVIAFIPKNLKISNRGEKKWIPFNSRWQLNTTNKDQLFWNTEKQKSQNTHYGPAVQLVILPKWSPELILLKKICIKCCYAHVKYIVEALSWQVFFFIFKFDGLTYMHALLSIVFRPEIFRSVWVHYTYRFFTKSNHVPLVKAPYV